MQVEYVAACEAVNEVVWLRKFLMNLGVIRIKQSSITLFCENNGVIAQSKE
jgi:hypothetical protein